MASKRNLKKNINKLTFELVSECMTFQYFHPEKDQLKIVEVMGDIVKKRNELVDKVNNPHDKENYKKNRNFYRGIKKDLQGMISLMDNLG